VISRVDIAVDNAPERLAGFFDLHHEHRHGSQKKAL
jgi:hypothetical protein